MAISPSMMLPPSPRDLTSPTEADVDTSVEAGAQALDKAIETNTPTGRYTKARLATFARSLQKVLDLLAPGGIAIPTDYPIDPQMDSQLPKELVAAYLTARSALQAYPDADEMTELDLVSPTDLINDQTLTRTAVGLDKLISDKDFKRWVKSQQVSTPQVKMESEGEMGGGMSSPGYDPELSAFFGRK
jgi:hypothetical protein